MGALDGYTIGLIGLGLMGKPMARNLAKAGAEVVIFNRSKEVVEELAGEGMIAADSPKEVAQRCPITIICVTNTPAAEAVLMEENGVIEGLQPGGLVIDMGTTAIERTREIGAAFLEKGGEYVDAPVSGGQVGAEQATLAIMAGGTDAAYARAEPVFRILGRNVNHVGGVGAGQIAKAANQIIVGMTIGAVSEALAFARAGGVDPGKVRDAIRGGFAESRILELHGERMVKDSFAPGGRAEVQLKDLNQAMDYAKAVGIALPGLQRNMELWERMLEKGWGTLDHSGLIKVIENP